MTCENFVVANGKLTVIDNFAYDLDYAFADQCDALLLCAETDLQIDLSAISYINSAYIGIIAATWVQAQAAGKTLKIFAPPTIVSYIKTSCDGCLEISEIETSEG